MSNNWIDRLGATEAVLTYHLHQELPYLQEQLLHPRWYPEAFHHYLEPRDRWQVLVEPSTAPILQLRVRVSIHGRVRLFKPDLLLHHRILGFGIPMEIETTCSWQTVEQVDMYGAMSTHLLLSSLHRDELSPKHVLAMRPFVICFHVPAIIRQALDYLRARIVEMLDDSSPHYLAFPETTPLGMLQKIISHDDEDLMHTVVTSSDLTALNKFFIIENTLVHGSDVMEAAVEKLEQEGLLNLNKLGQDAAKELPPQYMRYFTPEQLRGLTPEQLRGLTPEQLRGLTPEQLRGLTPEQQAAMLTQLTSDAEALRIVVSKLPSEARQQLLAVLQESERENE